MKALRIDVKGDHRVTCAGALWTGRSEVPADSLTAKQVAQLREHDQLEVTDIDRDDEEPAASGADAAAEGSSQG